MLATPSTPAEADCRLEALGLERRCDIWTGPGRSIVSYWVRQGALYNFLGTVPATEVQRESWRTTDGGSVTAD